MYKKDENISSNSTKDAKMGAIKPMRFSSEKSIPKVASSINFAVMQNGSLMMRFMWQASDEPEENLIETIIIDLDHAKNVSKVLEKILKDSEERMGKKK